MSAGGQIDVAVWSDPTNDRDPTDAVLLWSQYESADPALIDTGIFEQWKLMQRVPVEGDLFVGVVFRDVVSGGTPSPTSFATPSDRTWFITGVPGVLNLNAPTVGTQVLPFGSAFYCSSRRPELQHDADQRELLRPLRGELDRAAGSDLRVR